MSLREKVDSWRAAARYNERRWLLAKDLEWAIASTTTVDELIAEVERMIANARRTAEGAT